MAKATAYRLSEITQRQIEELARHYGNRTTVVTLAVDRFWRETMSEESILTTRAAFSSPIQMNKWLKNREGFPYCVSGFMGADLFLVPTQGKRDSIGVARKLLMEGRERARKEGRISPLDVSLEIADRSGAIFAEINRNGEVRKDPDFEPEASYFATVLERLKEELC